MARHIDAAIIADHLTAKTPDRSGCAADQRDRIVQQYHAVLDRQDRCDTARACRDSDNDFFVWFADNVAARLHLRAFDPNGGDDQ